MSSILSSPGVVLATAMAVSGVFLIALRREKNFPPTQFPGNQDSHPTEQIPRSCLSSDGKKRERKNKKRVQFAESVKDRCGNGEEYRKEHKKSTNPRSCRGQIREMPANRVALYSGVLRDRVQRSECSY
ncbi:DNA topoisomerase [Actinidia chinensis var. chinensis]|uniref:DNA topoisomerase n=1 Tax=Actinidia chinensis var. chinensis TaxID=1590841 RepID=A0A2R6QZN8_ACTCC|nr:DNA topoisomerase [Actinidia chinensis var. chinensis]